jgi:predicted esterase
MPKVTVFECFGTVDYKQITTQVKGTIDSDLFTYVPVTDYPNSFDNYGNSVAQGVASVLAKVTATPGKVVLVGVSQGAQIMANVYQSLRTGPRAADIVGVYLVGNPIRQAGRAFPGANPIPAGHGVAPAQYRLTNTPDLVWEFANPGDPVCTTGDDAAGLALSASFGQMMQNTQPSSPDFVKNVQAIMNFAKLIVTNTGIGQGGIINAVAGVVGFGTKHQYFEAFKPIAGDPRSGRQIICDHLNTVIGPLHATPPPPSPRYYGLVNDDFTPRLAAGVVARWNDGKKRHTVYTVCGTGQDGWGLVNLQSPRALLDANTLLRQVTGNPALNAPDLLPPEGTPGPNQFVTMDAAVGRAANPDLFNWVPISYPAAWPKEDNYLENNWEPANNSLNASAAVGVDELIRQINATPGTFALVGMSQGSVVISQVLKALLPGGVLAHRFNDCIAGLAYGNPCRKAKSGLPGVAPALGAGVISATYNPPPTSRLTSATQNPVANASSGLADVTLPSWWWEFANPGDVFCCAPMDTYAGPAFAPAVQGLFHLKGGLDFNTNAIPLTMLLLQGAQGFLVTLLTALAKGNFFSIAQIADFFNTAQAKALVSKSSQKQLDAPTRIISDFLEQHFGTINVPESIRTLRPVITPSNFYPNGDPHVRYGIDKPPSLPTGLAGVDANSTYVDVGIAYLNARGAAVAPR